MFFKRGRVFLYALFFLFSLSPFASVCAGESSGQSDKIVKEVEVKGLRAISKEAVISKMRLRPGQEYKEAYLSQDIKRIYATGFFSNVEIDPKDINGGVKLIVSVEEKPAVEKVIIKGNRVIPRKKLLDAFGIQEGEFLDERKIKDAISKIKDLYFTKGYNNASISYKIRENGLGKADLCVNIAEGARERVVKISVVGNKAFKDSQIIKLLETKRASLIFNKGIFEKERLDNDMLRIQAFYMKHGYINAKATYEIAECKSPSDKKIVIVIKEGPMYYVGKISIQGNSIIPKERLFNEIKIKTGDVFNPEEVDKQAKELQDIYFERGYAYTKVFPQTYVNDGDNTVDIVFSIKESGPIYIRQIKIEGNVKTKDKVIRREMRVYPGEKFNGKKLRRSLQRLMNLGYFEEVGFDLLDTDKPDTKDLLVKVKEQQTGTFSIGMGYSTVDNIFAMVEVEQSNFDYRNFPTFTGGGQKLRLRIESGSDSEDYLLSFTEPWLNDKPITFGFDLYKKSHDRETDTGYAYEEDRKGGKLRLGKELDEYHRIDGSIRYDQIEITDVIEDASSDLKKEEGKNDIIGLGLSWRADYRDNYIVPKQGYYVSLSSSVAGGIFGGDKDFYRLYLDSAYYTPLLGEDKILSLRLRTGIVNDFSDSSWVPIYERFFAGGANTIRGYRERRVGPLDSSSGDPIGGEAMAVFNVEYTVPLFDYVKGAVFFDAGNVWPEYDDLFSGDIYKSVGVGVRIKTPIGPASLDYGYPLKTEPGEDKKRGRFHFTMKHGF